MKRIITCFVVLIFFVADTYGQSFEGTVIYKNTYKSKKDGVTDGMMNTFLGTRQEYSIKGGNYLAVTNGRMVLWDLFINSDSKMYTKMSKPVSILWIDTKDQRDSVVSFELKKNAKKVLGYKCDELTFICKSGIQKYYFNAEFPIDANLFKNHLYGNYYEYLKYANAVPLLIIIENKDMNVTSIAVKITPSQVSDEVFKLPEGVTLEKNPN